MKNYIYRLCFQNPASGLLQIGQKLAKWQCLHNLLTRCHYQFFLKCSCRWLNFLVSGASFMAVSLLFLEFWQLLFIWPEIWKLKIPLLEFCQISGDQSKLRMCLMKIYLTLQNARFAAFTVSRLCQRENLHCGENTPTHRLRLKFQLN